MDIIFVAVLFLGFIAAVLFMGVRVVSQSKKLIVERFGQFQRVLDPGLNIIVPFIDRVAHTVDMLERQLPDSPIDVITSDNVQATITVSTFFRTTRPEYTVYRIRDVDQAVHTAVMGVTRASIGKVDFDSVQSDREKLSQNLKQELDKIAADWGVDITRSEIVDVSVNDETRRAMQQQLNAERERRATVMRAEGERSAVELRAQGELFAAGKAAEAQRLTADAQAYATRTIAAAIAENGMEAVRFDIAKKQIDAYAQIASGHGSRVVMLPNDAHQAFSGFMAAAALLEKTPAASGASGSVS